MKKKYNPREEANKEFNKIMWRYVVPIVLIIAIIIIIIGKYSDKVVDCSKDPNHEDCECDEEIHHFDTYKKYYLKQELLDNFCTQSLINIDTWEEEMYLKLYKEYGEPPQKEWETRPNSTSGWICFLPEKVRKEDKYYDIIDTGEVRVNYTECTKSSLKLTCKENEKIKCKIMPDDYSMTKTDNKWCGGYKVKKYKAICNEKNECEKNNPDYMWREKKIPIINEKVYSDGVLVKNYSIKRTCIKKPTPIKINPEKEKCVETITEAVPVSGLWRSTGLLTCEDISKDDLAIRMNFHIKYCCLKKEKLNPCELMDEDWVWDCVGETSKCWNGTYGLECYGTLCHKECRKKTINDLSCEELKDYYLDTFKIKVCPEWNILKGCHYKYSIENTDELLFEYLERCG